MQQKTFYWWSISQIFSDILLIWVILLKTGQTGAIECIQSKCDCMLLFGNESLTSLVDINIRFLSFCAETSGRCYAFPSNPPYCLYNFATLKPFNTSRCPIVTSQSGLSSLLVGSHNIKRFTMRFVSSEYVLLFFWSSLCSLDINHQSNFINVFFLHLLQSTSTGPHSFPPSLFVIGDICFYFFFKPSCAYIFILV